MPEKPLTQQEFQDEIGKITYVIKHEKVELTPDIKQYLPEEIV